MPKFLPTNFLKTSKPIAVVAGGAGFIGAHLCEKLLAKNIKVICLDNWQTGVRENVKHLLENPIFFLLERDTARGLPKNLIKVDYVFCPLELDNPKDDNGLPLGMLEASSVGIRNLLELAREKKARFLLVLITYTGDRFEEGLERPLSPQGVQGFAEALVWEYGRKKEIDVRVVRLQDVYGPRMALSPGALFVQFIKQMVYQRPLQVFGQFEEPVFPIFIDEAVAGIEKAMFAGAARRETTTIRGPKTPFSFLVEAAERIQGHNLPRTELETGLQKTLEWFLQKQTKISKIVMTQRRTDFWDGEERIDEHGENGEKDIQKTGRTKRKKIWLGPALLLVLLFWFFALPFVEIGTGIFALSFGKKAIVAQDTEAGLFWIRQAGLLFRWSKEGFLRWSAVPGLGKESVRFSKNAQVWEELSLLGESAGRALAHAKGVALGVFGKQQSSLETESQILSVQFQEMESKLAFLVADLGQDNFRAVFPGLSLWEESIDLAELRRTARAASDIFPHLNQLLGGKGKRRYLVLFENNAELRPTGGFIGSFGVATFEQGKLTGLDVQDVYSADGQLKGHVEPPPAIKQYLGEANWYLRDSNFSPDFPVSAQRAAWFIDKELGLTIDGVIAVDLEFVKKVLTETGEVELPDFGETITADNLYEKAQFAAEGDFFPGSRAKKNFLAALARALLLGFAEEPEEKLLPTARAAFWALGTRHAAVWTTNREVNNALKEAFWDGAIRDVSCTKTKKTCIPDYLQVVEANLGVNKANYFLDRAYSLEISVGPQKISHNLTISYKSRSQPGVWPGGDYKNYLRLFVPKGTSFISASVLKGESGEKEELEMEIGEETERTVGAVLANVPAQEKRELKVAWEMPTQNFTEDGQLLFLWQKQMGTGQDPVWARISLPSGRYRISASPAPTLTQGNTVGYNTNLARDLFINLLWQPENY